VLVGLAIRKPCGLNPRNFCQAFRRPRICRHWIWQDDDLAQGNIYDTWWAAKPSKRKRTSLPPLSFPNVPSAADAVFCSDAPSAGNISPVSLPQPGRQLRTNFLWSASKSRGRPTGLCGDFIEAVGLPPPNFWEKRREIRRDERTRVYELVSTLKRTTLRSTVIAANGKRCRRSSYLRIFFQQSGKNHTGTECVSSFSPPTTGRAFSIFRFCNSARRP